MPVNYLPPTPEQLLPVAGVTLGTAAGRIKNWSRDDVVLVSLDPESRAAGVFTRNRFCAAPVIVCRDHLARGEATRALLINAGNANAGTGLRGIDDARACCAAVARMLGCAEHEVLPFSTGVIMEPLPVDRVIAALPQCRASLSPSGWPAAVRAIMTTDTLPKAASHRIEIDGVTVTVTGMAKGAGMIAPHMATMLGFIATDAPVARAQLTELAASVAAASFNRITIDGDTSTNDSFILIASGKSSLPAITSTDSPAYAALRDAVTEVAQTLAQLIVRDGEGATKFMTVQVEGGSSVGECRQIAYAIGHSPLVKTAFYASDPNLGRILAAIGYAGIDDLDVGKIDLYLDDVLVATAGGRNPAYREEDGQRVMKAPEIAVRVVLGRGSAAARVWTCDFSHDYVSINADYRS